MRVGVVACVVLVACGHRTELSEQGQAREAYVRGLAEREGLVGLWSLASRRDVIFDEGVTDIEVDQPGSDAPVPAPSAAVVPRGEARRWIGRRVRILVHGDGSSDMRLELHGKADLERLFTRPRIAVSFDGAELYSALVEPDGRFAIHATVPRSALDGWSDVYIVLSSIHEPFRKPELLRVAQLDRVIWEPVAPGVTR